MDLLNIKSSLYDYTVEFVESSIDIVKKFDEHTFFVIDKNVYKLYDNIFSGIEESRIYLMDAVENKKNMNTVIEIIECWQKLGVRKDWKVVCFGGGITQDVTTIASNLFLRNIDWYFFPTTLLSMCDSCIGGKCGINLGQYKNQIGVFYPPKKIYIDTKFIDTLNDDDYVNGWGEILKFSLTNDSEFFEKLKNEEEYIPCKNIGKYIYEGLLTKKKVIEEDEFESDIRRVLNYGHTFGHALEAYTDNRIPHGKGVIWGIDVVNYMAWKKGLISGGYYFEIKNLIKNVFIKKEIVIDNPEELFDIIKTDKKVMKNVVSLAVLNGSSKLIVYPVEINEELKNMFISYIKETHEYYSN